jgi:hypothetical protein
VIRNRSVRSKRAKVPNSKGAARRVAIRSCLAAGTVLLMKPPISYANHGTYWYYGAAADSNGFYAYIYADNAVTHTRQIIEDLDGDPNGGGTVVNSAGNSCASGSTNVCYMPYTKGPSISIPSGHWYRAFTCGATGNGSGGVHTSPSSFNPGPCGFFSIDAEGYGQPGGAVSVPAGQLGTNINQAEVK